MALTMLNLAIHKPFWKRDSSEISEDEYAKLAVFVEHFPEWKALYRMYIASRPVTYLNIVDLSRAIEITLPSDSQVGQNLFDKVVAEQLEG